MRSLAAALACLALLTPVGSREEKYVALTFDDGPSGRYTQALLDGLADRNVQATFLLCGYRVKMFPELTQRIFDEGHEIGCHGYSHDPMESMSRRQIAAEIAQTQALLPQGCPVRFLRPPGGGDGDNIRQVAQARQLALLHWSVDPKDWATHDQKAEEKRVLETVQDGDIVLLHDMTDSSVQAALNIVDELLRQGYQIVTVSQLAQKRQTPLKPGACYRKFPLRDPQG